jgi:hypothetical protein
MANDLTNDERKSLEAAFQQMDAAPSTTTEAVTALPRAEFCKYWPQVKGVLQFLANLPVVPSKVKDAINLVIKAGDTAASVLC